MSQIQNFATSVGFLAAAKDVREALDLAYQAKPKDPVRIAYLNDHLRHNMAVARMHAHLAEVQALYDLRGSVDQLFQALTADPEPAYPARPPLELVTADHRCACGQATYSGVCPDCTDNLEGKS